MIQISQKKKTYKKIFVRILKFLFSLALALLLYLYVSNNSEAEVSAKVQDFPNNISANLIFKPKVLFRKLPLDPKETITVPTETTTESTTETTTTTTTIETTTKTPYISLGTFRISHYCPCTTCNGSWAGQPTASGTTLTPYRTIAVDPNVIPLGSKVLINGRTYYAEDTGGAIKGNRIDLCVSTHSEAYQKGIIYAEVLISRE